MIPQFKMNMLFYLLYFSDFINTFTAYLYQNLSEFSEINKLFFYVIMTSLKIVCPALGGFIIDHVQYNLNVLLISQCLTIVSYFYFFGYCFRIIQQYLYFAIGFQILAQQLQMIIILTMISKHFEIEKIPQQIAIFFQFGYAGRFVCAVFSFIIYYNIQNTNVFSLQENNILISIIALFPLVILICITLCLKFSFPLFKNDAYQKIPDLQLIPIQSKGNLLEAFKEILNTDRFFIALAAGSIMSIIQIWQQYQVTSIYYNFKEQISDFFTEDKKKYQSVLLFFVQEAPIIVSLIYARQIAYKITKKDRALKFLTDKSTDSLTYFLLSIMLLVCEKGMFGLKFCFCLTTLITQQYIYTVISISSACLIGVQKQNFRTQGLSFGLLSMFVNIFNMWVISVLSSIAPHQTSTSLTIIYGFAFGYCIIGIVLSKMLQFDKSFNNALNKAPHLRFSKLVSIE